MCSCQPAAQPLGRTNPHPLSTKRSRAALSAHEHITPACANARPIGACRRQPLSPAAQHSMSNTHIIEAHWAKRPDTLSPDNLLWKQYLTYIDIFKIYVNVTWQVTTWFYTITGAVLVYCFDHESNNSHLQFALVLPTILSFGFHGIFAFGAKKNKNLVRWLNYIRAELSLPGRPQVEILIGHVRAPAATAPHPPPGS